MAIGERAAATRLAITGARVTGAIVSAADADQEQAPPSSHELIEHDVPVGTRAE